LQGKQVELADEGETAVRDGCEKASEFHRPQLDVMVRRNDSGSRRAGGGQVPGVVVVIKIGPSQAGLDQDNNSHVGDTNKTVCMCRCVCVCIVGGRGEGN